MALSMLQPLNPTSRAATKLGDGGPSALEVAYKRKGMEMDLGKALQKAEADKAKVAQKEREANAKSFTLEPKTVSLPDTQRFAQIMGENQTWLGDKMKAFREGRGGDPGDPYTAEGQEWLARKQGVAQWASNSEQKGKHADTLVALIRANPHSYADGAEEAVEQWRADSKVNDTGRFIDPLEQFFDLDKHLKPYLDALKPSGGGQAIQMPDGSVKTTSSEYVMPVEVLDAVQGALLHPSAGKEALRRFQALATSDPESAKAVTELAAKNKIPVEQAMIWNEVSPVYSYKKYSETLKEQSDGGYGREVDEIGAINFIEKGIGMNDPSNAGKSFAEMGMKGDFETVKTFLNANPDLERFSVSIPRDAEVFNGYNGMIYKQTKDTEGKEHNRYVAGIARDPVTGKTQIVTTDANGGDVEVSKPIASERFYSEVMDPLAEHNPELDHKKVGYVYQKKYGPIQGQEGNIPLPRKGGALDLEAGELD